MWKSGKGEENLSGDVVSPERKTVLFVCSGHRKGGSGISMNADIQCPMRSCGELKNFVAAARVRSFVIDGLGGRERHPKIYVDVVWSGGSNHNLLPTVDHQGVDLHFVQRE